MKLKKLLPITAMASVAAVAVPLATSCFEQKGTTIKGASGEDIPYPEQIDATPYDSDKAMTTSYLEAVNKDKTIFAKDVLSGILDAYGEDTTNDVRVADARVDSVDVENHTISYTVHAQAKNSLGNMTYDLTFAVKNVEILVHHEGPLYNRVEPLILYYNGTSGEKYYDELIKLSQDNSGEYTLDYSGSLGTELHKVVNHTNMGDYADDIIERLVPAGRGEVGSLFYSTYYEYAYIG